MVIRYFLSLTTIAGIYGQTFINETFIPLETMDMLHCGGALFVGLQMRITAGLSVYLEGSGHSFMKTCVVFRVV